MNRIAGQGEADVAPKTRSPPNSLLLRAGTSAVDCSTTGESLLTCTVDVHAALIFAALSRSFGMLVLQTTHNHERLCYFQTDSPNATANFFEVSTAKTISPEDAAVLALPARRRFRPVPRAICPQDQSLPA